MSNRAHLSQYRSRNPLTWMKAVLWLGWIAIGLNIWLITR